MHGLGHGVGLQVHDPDISTMEGFQTGSAVTIEPGIYLRADALDYLPDTPGNRAMIRRLRPTLERYANIGVRIEDVYIFDESGVERASRGVPREIAEIDPGDSMLDRHGSTLMQAIGPTERVTLFVETIELRGEGIFLRFDLGAVREWEARAAVLARVAGARRSTSASSSAIKL